MGEVIILEQTTKLDKGEKIMNWKAIVIVVFSILIDSMVAEVASATAPELCSCTCKYC